MAPVLGYWTYRGVSEAIRTLLRYVGEEFEDRRYEQGDPPDLLEDWAADRDALDLLLPDLPYYVDDDVRLTQSSAILHYLADKYDLGPQDAREKMLCDMLEGHFNDIKNDLIRVAFHNPDWEKLLPLHFDNMCNRVKHVEKMLETDQPWLLGERLTYVDFLAYDILDIERLVKDGCLDDFPNVLQYLSRFEELPQIKEYQGSGDYVRTPVFGRLASFANEADE